MRSYALHLRSINASSSLHTYCTAVLMSTQIRALTLTARDTSAESTITTVRVYQAYNEAIAKPAAKAGRFLPETTWSPRRMSWIKPSLVWMGYRCGWSLKDENQACVLAIDLHKHAFDQLLVEAVPADRAREGDQLADVVVQWDPERELGGEPGRNAYTHPMHDVRSLQMGLRGAVGERFGNGEGVAAISNVTPLFRAIGDHLKNGNIDAARALLPEETLYALPVGCAI